MARLLFRLVFESLFAGAFITAGILIISLDNDLPQFLGWAGIALGGLIFVHVVAAAAFGKVRTPSDLGVGFRVPGYPDRPKREGDGRKA